MDKFEWCQGEEAGASRVVTVYDSYVLKSIPPVFEDSYIAEDEQYNPDDFFDESACYEAMSKEAKLWEMVEDGYKVLCPIISVDEDCNIYMKRAEQPQSYPHYTPSAKLTEAAAHAGIEIEDLTALVNGAKEEEVKLERRAIKKFLKRMERLERAFHISITDLRFDNLGIYDGHIVIIDYGDWRYANESRFNWSF